MSTLNYIVKYSPEITIKSRPVRVRFARQLRRNLKTLLRRIDRRVEVSYHWDFITIAIPESTELIQTFEQVLTSTPGISSVNRVLTSTYTNLDAIAERVLLVYRDRLDGRSFAVRCKRVGKHSFSSVDVERHLGAFLMQHSGALRVSLNKPDVRVPVEIRDDQLHIIDEALPGLGGFPVGAQDAVLSLISGGFDSAVASWMTMRRGLLTHFLFFNLGGREHELAVKEVALYLWLRYGASHRVAFISVPFEAVVAEILDKVDNAQMGVVLKRMMLRAASQIAAEREIDALITGESVAQVSSQTLRNLSVIDEVTDMLVLRPLAMTDKQDIVDTARAIGTEDFSAAIPEYCGVISVKPTTRARPERVKNAEANFDFTLLEQALAVRETSFIDEFSPVDEDLAIPEEFVTPPQGAVVVDIRHPDEVLVKSLSVPAGVELEHIPFFRLNNSLLEKDRTRHYLLYCDKGVMSRLHASYLLEEGYQMGVFRPSAA